MRDLVRQGSGHPVVRWAAEDAVAGVHPRDGLAQVLAVRDWIASHVEYRRDPALDEWLQTPWYVIRCQIARGKVPQLDCDDLTDLSGALLGSIGFPFGGRVVSTRPDGRYNHVYGLVKADGRWWPLDMTRTWARPGSSAPRETRARNIPMIGEAPPLSMLAVAA